MNKIIVNDIVKASLFEGVEMSYDDICWKELFNELASQSILGIPLKILNNENVTDSETLLRWKQMGLSMYFYYYKMLEVQDETIRLLENAEIDVVVIKGVAAGQYYPDIKYRTYGDIDLLVLSEKYEEACNLLKDNGFLMKKNQVPEYHTEFSNNGFEIEIHKYIPLVRTFGSSNTELLNCLFSSAIKNKKYIMIEKYKVPCLPDFENGMVLLFHIIQHIKSGIGYKQIIDWMMFVNLHLNGNVWENDYFHLLEKLGLAPFAKTVTLMCSLYLGLEKMSWYQDANEDLAECLMDFVYSQGNFGCKMKNSDRDVKVFTKSKGLNDFLKNVTINSKYRLFSKYGNKIPNVGYTIIGLIHYIKMASVRKKSFSRLVSALSESKERKNFFSELGI